MEEEMPDNEGQKVESAEAKELSPVEILEFQEELDGYIEGLRAAIEEMKASGASEEEIAELEEQLEGLTDSAEAIEEEGADTVIRIKPTS